MVAIELKERNKEWAVQGSVAAACVIAAFLILIKPAITELGALHRDIRSSQKRQELYKTMVELTAEVKKLESGFSGLDDRMVLLGRMTDLADESKIIR